MDRQQRNQRRQGHPNGETELISGPYLKPNPPITDYVFGKMGLQYGLEIGALTPFRIDYSKPSFLNLGEKTPWEPREVVIHDDHGPTDWVWLNISNIDGFSPHPVCPVPPSLISI